MIIKFQSSIGSTLFENVEKWRFFWCFWSLKIEKWQRGRAPTLRVPRAVTRLTVHHSLQYRNSSEAGQKGRLHDGAPGHEKVFSENHCFMNVPVNLHNCCEEGIEVYRNGSKVWNSFWNSRVLSIPDILKKLKNDGFLFDIFEKLEKWKMTAEGGFLLFEFPER